MSPERPAADRAEKRVIAGLPLTWREFGSGADDGFGMWILADPDAPLDMITQAEFESQDERMPYFGLIWPSAESLVEKILAGPALDGVRALDLGCGLGACGFAALALGAHVTFFDWEPRAIEIVAATAGDQGWNDTRFDLAVGDWRQPPAFGPFDLILAADVLYERRNVPAVAAFIRRRLATGGEAWVADPGRIQAGAFPDAVAAEGMQLTSEELAPQPHGSRIVLHRVCLTAVQGAPQSRVG